MEHIVRYIIIAVVLIIIAIAIAKTKKRDFRLDANKLVELLGGKDNIVSYEVNKSRFVVELKDVSLANKEGIQKWVRRGLLKLIIN